MGRKQSQSTEAVWRDRLARFRKSNLTVAEFCQQEGVSDPSFYQWRKRLQHAEQRSTQVRRRSAPKAAAPAFVPVNVPSTALAEIEFPNGVRIRVPATNAAALRAAILAAIELFQEAT